MTLLTSSSSSERVNLFGTMQIGPFAFVPVVFSSEERLDVDAVWKFLADDSLVRVRVYDVSSERPSVEVEVRSDRVGFVTRPHGVLAPKGCDDLLSGVPARKLPIPFPGSWKLMLWIPSWMLPSVTPGR